MFTLHYDAYEAFEEADHDVCFVDKYRLLHLEDGAEMTWKVEGGEVDREAVMASLSGEDVDLQEVSFFSSALVFFWRRWGEGGMGRWESGRGSEGLEGSGGGGGAGGGDGAGAGEGAICPSGTYSQVSVAISEGMRPHGTEEGVGGGGEADMLVNSGVQGCIACCRLRLLLGSAF